MDNMKVFHGKVSRILYIAIVVSSVPVFIEIWNGNIFCDNYINVTNLTYTLLYSILIAFICLTIGVLLIARLKKD